jgi:hypothetical protein
MCPCGLSLKRQKPEDTAPIMKPIELIRKIDPACPVLIPRSADIVGRSGEK